MNIVKNRFAHAGATLSVVLIALVVSSLVLVATPEAGAVRQAHAAGMHLAVSPSGQRLAVRIRSRRGAVCRLTVSTKNRTVGFSAVRLAADGRGRIKWQVPASAPSGRWSFLVTCVSSSRAVSRRAHVILINHGSGRGPLVDSKTVRLTAAQYAAAPTAPSGGQAIVNAASSQVGVTYCWDGGKPNATIGPTHGDGYDGGEAPDCRNPSTVGWDCTGFVIYAAYHGTGGAVNLNAWHDSTQAEHTPGQWITSESQLEPGDIVYFGSSRADTDHAAIYAGSVDGKQMVWDANTAFWIYPDGVHERSLSSETTGSDPLHFVGAARVWTTSGAPAPVSSGGGTSGSGGTGTGTGTGKGNPTGGGGTGSNPVQASTYAETTGSIAHTWSDPSDGGGTQGAEIVSNQTVQITCWVSGLAVADGNTYWYEVASGPWDNAYFVSADAFYNNGSTSGTLSGTPFVDPAVPNCSGSTGSAGGAKPTYAETTGSVAHTWTNASDGGGTEGPEIGSNQTVEIACWVSGLEVADGNTYWYEIASSPWNNAYYVSADAFYNDGRTSGSLVGTPFVDPAVSQC
jgi:hypothetical protein